MKSVNRVSLLGYIGNDLVMRTSNNGTKYIFVNIATSKAVKKGETWEDQVEWNSVSVWGSGADYLQEYAGKGTLIYFEGRVETKDSGKVDREKNPIYKTYIGGQHVAILRNPGSTNPGKEPRNGNQRNTGNNRKQSTYNQQFGDDNPFIEDDVPF